MSKGYFPLFFDTFEETEDLTDEEFGRLIRAAGSYAMGTDAWTEIITGNEKYAFRFLKGQIDRNIEISKARARAGSTRKEQQETNKNKEEQNETKEAEKESKKRFVPPTVDEVRAYCDERKNGIDPEYFVAYNENRNWTLSNGKKMKDWKLAIVTWEKNGFRKSGSSPVKTVSAQNYSQRDYSGEQDDAMRRMLEGVMA